MRGVMTFADVVGCCAVAFVVHKTIEPGPYEVAILFGRYLHIFVAATQGYL